MIIQLGAGEDAPIDRTTVGLIPLSPLGIPAGGYTKNPYHTSGGLNTVIIFGAIMRAEIAFAESMRRASDFYEAK